MINWKRRKYTKQEFIEAWSSSKSIAEVARKLNCNKTGSGYDCLKYAARELGLTVEHMTGQGWAIGKKFSRPLSVPISELLVLHDPPLKSKGCIKKALFSEGIKEKKCEICSLSEWMGDKIPLSLHHINGNKNDNRIENLQVLCYNCHGQTFNFAGKSRKSLSSKKERPPKLKKLRVKKEKVLKNLCLICKTPTKNKKFCSHVCAHKYQEKIHLTNEELKLLIERHSYSSLGKLFGVSGNAIKFKAKKLGLI